MDNNMPYPDGRRDPYGRYDVPAPPEEPRLTIWPRGDVVRGRFYVCPSCGKDYVNCEPRACEGGASGQFYNKVTDEVVAEWSCPYDKGDAPLHLHVCCDNCKHVFALEPAKAVPGGEERRAWWRELIAWTIFGAVSWGAGFLAAWSTFG